MYRGEKVTPCGPQDSKKPPSFGPRSGIHGRFIRGVLSAKSSEAVIIGTHVRGVTQSLFARVNGASLVGRKVTVAHNDCAHRKAYRPGFLRRPSCDIFHRWSPAEALAPQSHADIPPCRGNPTNSLPTSPFRTTHGDNETYSGVSRYNTTRPVMNRYFYGPGNGLPLRVLRQKASTEWEQRSLPERTRR